jgi:hypothetical protein
MTNNMNFDVSAVFRSDSAHAASPVNGKRLDNNDRFFFKEELERIDPNEYKSLNNELSFLSTFYTDTSTNPGVESNTYRMYEDFGQSDFSAKNASDTPLVNVTGKKFSSFFANIDVALEYTDQDILASRVADNNIIARLRNTALRSNYEFMNKLCFYGNKVHEIEGLLPNKHITNKKPVVTVRSTKTNWSSKTPEEIVADIMNGYNDSLEATNNNILPDTLLMSLGSLNIIRSRIFNSFDGATIFRQIENMTNCKIKGLHELNKAFPSDSNGFIFFKNKREFIEQLMPIPFSSTEPQQIGWTHKVYCRSRYGGLVIRQPSMFVMRYGI